MNSVCLVGRLTADPEMRTTGSGKEVASFSIAVQKIGKPKDGEKDADFFRCTVWEQGARYLCDYAVKGNRISVVGRIENRSFTDKDGNNRTVTEVIANNVSILESKNVNSGDAAPAREASRPAPRPVATSDAEYDPFADE